MHCALAAGDFGGSGESFMGVGGGSAFVTPCHTRSWALFHVAFGKVASEGYDCMARGGVMTVSWRRCPWKSTNQPQSSLSVGTSLLQAFCPPTTKN